MKKFIKNLLLRFLCNNNYTTEYNIDDVLMEEQKQHTIYVNNSEVKSDVTTTNFIIKNKNQNYYD